MEQRRADQQLVAVFNELIGLGQATKQGVWMVPRGPLEDAVRDLMNCAFRNAAAVADLEASIDGRSSEMVSPSAHESPNLSVESQDARGIVLLLIEQALTVAADVRRRGADLGASEVGMRLRDIADELDQCAAAMVTLNSE